MKQSRLVLSLCLLAGCAQPEPRSAQTPAPDTSATCDAYGYQRGSEAYKQCATEVDKALWRAARAPRARQNCTPMGDQVVCR